MLLTFRQTVPKYEGHPFYAATDDRRSPGDVRNHLRVIKGLSTRLNYGKYTEENMLGRLKVPKGTRSVMTTLSDEETGALGALLN